MQNNCLKYAFRLCGIAFAFIFSFCCYAQNSLVGDGFGGRLWYKPYNYTVGSYSAYTVCGDSAQLYGWGRNTMGQLGDGTYTGRRTPKKVLGMSNVKYYSTGYCMGAIKKDESGWYWGSGTPKPIQVIDSVFFLDAGTSVCVYIKKNGTVWSVGYNGDGSFGNGKIESFNQTVPSKMLSLNTAVRVANGGYSTIVLLKNGNVSGTGNNLTGAIGNGVKNTITVSSPIHINGLKNIIDIKANALSNIALDKNGSVYSWGSGKWGCLGINSLRDTNFPVKIPNLKNIVAISGCNDGDHFLALDSMHNCYAWGNNQAGQLGAPVSESDTPTLVATDVADIMAGETFSYIVKSDGTLWAAGSTNILGTNQKISIWMNLRDSDRYFFTQIDPAISPMNLCQTAIMNEKNQVFNICRGDTINVGKKKYFASGNYRDTLIGYYKDDSVVVTKISVKPVSRDSFTHYLCYGDSIKINKRMLKKAGIYFDTFINFVSCDSIVSTKIIVRPQILNTFTTNICQGQSLKVKFNNYAKTGVYLDTFTGYFGCDSIQRTELTVIPTTYFNQNKTICSGDAFKFNKHNYFSAGNYSDTIQNQRGCDSVVTTALTVNPKPTADFNFNPGPYYLFDTIRFQNNSSGADNYLWRFGTEDKETSTFTNPQKVYLKDGKFYTVLIAKNSQTGCMDSISKMVEVLDNSGVYVPNSFTPDGDGKNDFFFPSFMNYSETSLKIFSRWGEKLYEGTASSPGWDGNYNGKPCAEGTYVYLIELKKPDTKSAFVLNGNITLMRTK